MPVAASHVNHLPIRRNYFCNHPLLKCHEIGFGCQILNKFDNYAFLLQENRACPPASRKDLLGRILPEAVAFFLQSQSNSAMPATGRYHRYSGLRFSDLLVTICESRILPRNPIKTNTEKWPCGLGVLLVGTVTSMHRVCAA